MAGSLASGFLESGDYSNFTDPANLWRMAHFKRSVGHAGRDAEVRPRGDIGNQNRVGDGGRAKSIVHIRKPANEMPAQHEFH
ncbi:hypothetical protein [Cupriavidus pauculus]|uniref:Uncharacterized protein n=1 Tax=Cupriavidus pauculus TaxID=82633 RepID=A0A3G8H692_9BURK|nr:hypothetical protein [Cupriavidus pauculus]AZG15610.1 hypothetical protein EHF44_19245 [Cupriavidus pauculus]